MIKKAIFLCLVCAALIPAARAQTAKQTHPVTAVIHIDAMPQYTAAVGGILKNYLEETRKEKGIKRCNIFQEVGRANHYTMVEEWSDQAAYDTHLGDAHTRSFRDKIQSMLGAPVDERLHTELE